MSSVKNRKKNCSKKTTCVSCTLWKVENTILSKYCWEIYYCVQLFFFSSFTYYEKLLNSTPTQCNMLLLRVKYMSRVLLYKVDTHNIAATADTLEVHIIALHHVYWQKSLKNIHYNSINYVISLISQSIKKTLLLLLFFIFIPHFVYFFLLLFHLTNMCYMMLSGHIIKNVVCGKLSCVIYILLLLLEVFLYINKQIF